MMPLADDIFIFFDRVGDDFVIADIEFFWRADFTMPRGIRNQHGGSIALRYYRNFCTGGTANFGGWDGV